MKHSIWLFLLVIVYGIVVDRLHLGLSGVISGPEHLFCMSALSIDMAFEIQEEIVLCQDGNRTLILVGRGKTTLGADDAGLQCPGVLLKKFRAKLKWFYPNTFNEI